MMLFIDFRKAFDTVDSKLLITKLRCYGFSDKSLILIQNYFTNRMQVVKFGSLQSDLNAINLGIPQGSVLGPLLFLIFINDLHFLLDLISKLFADDTTLYKISKDTCSSLENLLESFKISLQPVLTWCEFNKMDINWSKTHFMFVTTKRVTLPEEIQIGSQIVKVVKTFKLLGIEIDNKLNFRKHISNTCKSINSKLFSYKKLFYLSTSVKIQFFKTFILPHFDYCLSLAIYFPKYVLQRLCNSYYLCLYKLFGFSFHTKSLSEINSFLKNFKLFSFEYRIFLRLSYFIHKIFNLTSAPPLLKNILQKKISNYALRKNERFLEPLIRNHYGESTFSYFFTKFLNNLYNTDIILTFLNFKKSVLKDIDSFFQIFVNIFSRFRLEYKVYTFR